MCKACRLKEHALQSGPPLPTALEAEPVIAATLLSRRTGEEMNSGKGRFEEPRYNGLHVGKGKLAIKAPLFASQNPEPLPCQLPVRVILPLQCVP